MQEEKSNGRKLKQAIMTIILNSLYIASSFREKLRAFFMFFNIITKRKEFKTKWFDVHQNLEKKAKGDNY